MCQFHHHFHAFCTIIFAPKNLQSQNKRNAAQGTFVQKFAPKMLMKSTPGEHDIARDPDCLKEGCNSSNNHTHLGSIQIICDTFLPILDLSPVCHLVTLELGSLKTRLSKT
jgi:hypothetical protein